MKNLLRVKKLGRGVGVNLRSFQRIPKLKP